MTTVVYKIGGSLLTLPDLGARLDRLLMQRPSANVLLVAGGGAAADLVREWDRRFALGESRAHWLALRAVGLNEALLLDLLPAAVHVHRREEADVAWQTQKPAVACAFDILREEALRPTASLPYNWNVTSDSIAAWIAGDWSADELVLLKSTPFPPGCTMTQATERGLTDPYFREIAGKLSKVGWIDLREPADFQPVWIH
jgi:5-(aminomethyl)-3-furanmethanol phosphate kinase